MPQLEPDTNQTLERLTLLLYLVPVFGVVPSLWSLSRRKSSKQTRSVSRLVITLATLWIASFTLLSTGSNLSPSLSLRLLTTNTLLTTGYFLTNFWLMLRLLRGKSVRLPGISPLSKRLS